MNKQTKKVSEPKKLLHELGNDLNRVVVKEHQILQHELTQISTLIRDAIKILENSFNCISEQASEQLQLVKSIIEITTVNNNPDDLTRLSELTKGITNNVANAVRSLQFEDIVQQLTAHSNNRVEQMGLLLSRLGDRLDKLNTIDSENIELAIQTIRAMQDDLQNFCNTVEKENPVKQHSMKEGKIELF